ncbi:MAG: hypothetical protein ABI361_09525 [Nitrososphaera sp.]|jgi:hypothetical protein
MAMADLNKKLDNSPKNQAALMQQAADLHAQLQATFEKYLIAIIQANYDMTDEQILQKLIDSRKTAVLSNAQYHQERAKVEKQPIVASQHKLLATMYSSLYAKFSSS